MSKRKKALPVLILGLASVALWSGQACAEELLTRKDGSQYLGFLKKDKEQHQVFVTCNGTRFPLATDDKVEATDETCPKESLPGVMDVKPPAQEPPPAQRNGG